MSLVAHWPLEGNPNDEAFGNYNGTEIGGVSYGDGILGGCYDNTSGSGTGIQLMEHADAKKFDNVFSWSLWFKSTTTNGSNNERILARDDSEYPTFTIDQNQSGQQNLDSDAAGSAQVNEWHHAAFVHQSDQTVITYIDGVRQGTRSAPKANTARPWVIGGNTEGDGDISGGHFEGKIDDVRFYDHVLSKAEVKELAQGKVGHWDFFDGNAYDSTIQRNHGTLQGNPQRADGIIGSDSLNLDGSGDYISVSYDHNDAEQITLSGWVNQNSQSDWARLADFGTNSNNYVFIAPYNSGGDPTAEVQVNGNSKVRAQDGSTTLGTNTWYHMACTYDGSTLILYIDGQQAATGSGSYDLRNIDFSNSYIGRSQYSDPDLDAKVDDVRVYSTALSQNEIQTIYETKARLDENHRFFGHQLQENNIRYEWYDTQTYYDNNSHPNSASGLDQFFDPSNSGVNVGGSGIHENSVAWGDSGQAPNSKPSYLPSDGFSWKVDGSIYVPETGTYTFGLDSDDASDIFINGTQVASFYGGHGFDGNFNNNGTINLEKGNHSFRARMEEGGGGDGIHVAWQKPSDSSFSTVPQENYLHGPSVKSTGKIESTLSEVGPAADSLIGWWDFDRENARDKAGNNDGTLNGGVSFAKGVSGGKSVSLDGSNDRVNTDLRPDQSGSKSYTFSLWANPSTQTSGRSQAIGTDTGGFDWAILMENNDWYVFTGEASRFFASLQDNTWQHVVAVFDSVNSEVRAYKDGQLERTHPIGFDSDTDDIAIGQRSERNDENFPGKIDDVRVYDRGLTDEEVNVLYEMSKPEAKMKKRPEGFYAPQFSETQL